MKFVATRYNRAAAGEEFPFAVDSKGEIQRMVNYTLNLEGRDAKNFMNDMGYEFKPTQQIRDELELNVNIDYDKFGISTISGSQTFITEKSGYVPKGSIEDGIIPIKPNNLLYLENHTVNRFQITYTTNAIKKILNSLMPYIGYRDFRIPTVYSSLSEYPRNNKYINLFLKKRK